MGSCFSKPTVDGPPSLDTRDVTPHEPSLSQQQSGAKPERKAAQFIEEPSYGRRPTRDRVQSTPHKVPPMNDVELPLSLQRTRAKSTVASSSSNSRGPYPDQRQTSAEQSRTAPRQTVMNRLARRPLDSKVREVFAEDIKCALPHYPSHNSCISPLYSPRLLELIII
jgi:hypothetical protein